MIELLWLLVPIAVASGWWAARYGTLSHLTQTSFKLSPDYFKGLNYLLNEEPDKAIDVFIKLLDVNSDTVETHLALGTFFRRRGEVNRAIRLHQNLIARPALNSQQRSLALLELGQDYRQAGLLDRAEDLFQELIGSKTHQTSALHQLLDIYQQEQDWEQAIQTAKKLATITSSKPMHTVIAQYYCEQAEYFYRHGQAMLTFQAIKQALEIDPNCVRASLLEGQYALDNGQREQAIIAFQRVEQQDPDYLVEVIKPLQICYQESGQQAVFTHYLHQVLERYGGITPMLVLAKLIKQQEGDKPAVDFISKYMNKHPSIPGLNYLLDLALSTTTENVTREHLLLLKDIITQLVKNKPAYKCIHCGFTTRKLHWQCPSCQQWSTLKPIQWVNGEFKNDD